MRYKYNVGDKVQRYAQGPEFPVVAANERTFLVREGAHEFEYAQAGDVWKIVGAPAVSEGTTTSVSQETEDDECRRICPTIMNGHYEGCPFLSGGKKAG